MLLELDLNNSKHIKTLTTYVKGEKTFNGLDDESIVKIISNNPKLITLLETCDTSQFSILLQMIESRETKNWDAVSSIIYLFRNNIISFDETVQLLTHDNSVNNIDNLLNIVTYSRAQLYCGFAGCVALSDEQQKQIDGLCRLCIFTNMEKMFVRWSKRKVITQQFGWFTNYCLPRIRERGFTTEKVNPFVSECCTNLLRNENIMNWLVFVFCAKRSRFHSVNLNYESLQLYFPEADNLAKLLVI